jgi:hypothetical protein
MRSRIAGAAFALTLAVAAVIFAPGHAHSTPAGPHRSYSARP